MPELSVSQLGLGQVDEALPLALMAAPRLDPDDWHDRASRLIARSGGLIGVYAPDSRLHGIAAYRPDCSLRLGRTLRVELMVSFELSRRAPVRTALVGALELIAEAMGCETLSIEMDHSAFGPEPDAAPRSRLWRTMGLEPESLVWAKSIEREEALQVAAGR